MFALSKESVASAATTSVFVLLWSSGAIVSKLGLAHASPFAFLLMRSALALCGLLMLAPMLGLRWPRGRSAVLQALVTGAVLLGAYQIFYLLYTLVNSRKKFILKSFKWKLKNTIIHTYMGERDESITSRC